MTIDRRITVGNILTILSFLVIGLLFVLTTRSTAVNAADAVANLEPRVAQNTALIRDLEDMSDHRGEDIQYITDVVKAIADAVDAKIPIKDPSN